MVIPLVVFLSGGCVMMVELVGSRVIAPYVGNSIYAWTALISVVLGSLSIGYTLGGRLADRYPSYTLLSGIFFLSACAVVLIKPIEFVLMPLTGLIPDVRYLAIIFSLAMFFLPSVLLGMISPYTIRLSLHSLSGTGKTAGNLSALSTAGSIVGTVGTGFYLFGTLGHSAILLLVVCLLLFCGVLVWLRGGKKSPMLFVIVGFPVTVLLQDFPAHPLGVERDTPYQRVFIRDDIDADTQRPVRMLLFDTHGIQSAMFLDQDDDLVNEYTKTFRVADAYVPNPEHVLVVGGAGYSYPKDLLRRHETTNVDVVEIDPGMTTIAKEWFTLPQQDRLSVTHADGRMFLTHTTKKYDVIYMDAFGALVVPPFHLLTQEMFQLARQRISENGVLVINIIGAYEGPKSRLLSAIYRTGETVFPVVSLYSVGSEGADATQNIILVASQKHPSTQPIELVRPFTPDTEISLLTDEFAPVEQYGMELLNKYTN